MTNLLKRLSINLERRGFGEAESSHSPPVGVTSSASFNDFSMHIGQEVDEQPNVPKTDTQHIDVPFTRRSFDPRPSSMVVGSAPAGFSPRATKSLTIPRTSVAHILMRDTPGTPRSPLEGPCNSLPTPRTSFSDDVPSSPRSPHSPTSPGGRRRRQQKIHGMDYYEFCELVRAGSL